MEIIKSIMAIVRRVFIPRYSFSSLSLEVDEGVKNPVMATNVMMEVGTTKFIT